MSNVRNDRRRVGLSYMRPAYGRDSVGAAVARFYREVHDHEIGWKALGIRLERSTKSSPDALLPSQSRRIVRACHRASAAFGSLKRALPSTAKRTVLHTLRENLRQLRFGLNAYPQPTIDQAPA